MHVIKDVYIHGKCFIVYLIDNNFKMIMIMMMIDISFIYFYGALTYTKKNGQ